MTEAEKLVKRFELALEKFHGAYADPYADAEDRGDARRALSKAREDLTLKCLPEGVLFDAFGRQRVRYVRVTLDGSHLILHPSELDAFKAGEENPDQFAYTDVYLSEEEADALPEFEGF